MVSTKWVTWTKCLACKCSVSSGTSTCATLLLAQTLFVGLPSCFLESISPNILTAHFLTSFRPPFTHRHCLREDTPQPARHIGASILYPPVLTCFFFLDFSQRDTIPYNYLVIHCLSALRKHNLPEGSSPVLALKKDLPNERVDNSISYLHSISAWTKPRILRMYYLHVSVENSVAQCA